MKTPALILTSSILILITTLNQANTSSNPIPFLPSVQHSQSQSQPSEDPQPQQYQQMSQITEKQPSHTNAHNNQFDNQSASVTSVMPF
jgi:hypothetical protein